MLKIAINGGSGRMGQEISQIILGSGDKYQLEFATARNAASGNYLTELPASTAAEVVIDFSTPAACMGLIKWALPRRLPVVIGTTGFSAEQLAQINFAAGQIPILLSPNMSLSVNVLFKISQSVAKILAEFEVEISESHHRYKKDAPSGTALRLGQAVANARGQDFASVAAFNRCAATDQTRRPEEIGFAVTRGGDIVGKHQLSFISDGEELNLISEIRNRQSFASGAVMAAKFIAAAGPGLYTMEDVLNLKAF